MSRSENAAHLVEGYLADLAESAGALPRARRDELLEDVRSHIEVALSESAAGDRADEDVVRRILDSLGEPDEIVAAALVDAPPAQVHRYPAGMGAGALAAVGAAAPRPVRAGSNRGAWMAVGAVFAALVVVMLVGVLSAKSSHGSAVTVPASMTSQFAPSNYSGATATQSATESP